MLARAAARVSKPVISDAANAAITGSMSLTVLLASNSSHIDQVVQPDEMVSACSSTVFVALSCLSGG